MNDSYSTKNISPLLIDELKHAIKSVTSYGSIEIFVQNGRVTQISTRHIKKTVLENGNGHSNGKSMDNVGL
ncbi:MAG TPA: DUF2292 domain-containing protein [Patescibacteria group bacterium]|nr:DUF2292 domain-containing protein [Patescibacteria group bacterium]